MFEEIKPSNLNKIDGIPQYNDANQGDELDLLYGKSVPRRFSRPNINRTPSVYLAVGFVAGILFTLLVMGIISLSTKEVRHQVVVADDTVQQEQSIDENKTDATLPVASSEGNEKYTIKTGDTLDKIVFRFFGKYDNAKIEQIQKLNNIKNPASLQIGQEIIIPMSR